MNFDSAQGYARKADEYKSRGEYHKALEYLEYALDLDSTLSHVRLNLGWSHFMLEDFDAASEVFSECIRRHQNDAYAFYGRGLAQSEIGKYQLAIEDLTEAIRLDPNISEAHFSLGTCFSKVGRRRDSIAAFSECLRLDPEHPPALLSRGTTYALFGQREAALVDLTKHIDMEPNNWVALHCRARVNLPLTNYLNAVSDFDGALDACPDLGKLAHVTFLERGFCHAMNGDFQEAMSDYNEAIKLDSHNFRVYVNRAKVFQNMGDTKAAENDIEKALFEGLPKENANQLRRELDLGKE